LLRGFAEVKLRRRLKPVHAVAEVDLVGVQRENLGLGEAAFNLDGQQRLLDLAMKRAVGRKKKIARELHGEGRSALYSTARFDVPIGRAGDPPDVDAPVAVELFVFDREQRVTEHRRKIVVGRDDPALQGKGADDASLLVV